MAKNLPSAACRPGGDGAAWAAAFGAPGPQIHGFALRIRAFAVTAGMARGVLSETRERARTGSPGIPKRGKEWADDADCLEW
jgi:hypothetical protein